MELFATEYLASLDGVWQAPAAAAFDAGVPVVALVLQKAADGTVDLVMRPAAVDIEYDDEDDEDEEPEHSGLFIGAFLDRAAADVLAVAGGEDADELHVTLAYLADWDIEDVVAAVAACAIVARSTPILEGEVAGLGEFHDHGEGAPVWAACDVRGLDKLRSAICEQLGALGVEMVESHGWTPHITLGYGMRGLVNPGPVPLMFDSITIGVGDARLAFPFGSTVTTDEADAMIEKAAQARDSHGRWSSGGGGVGFLGDHMPGSVRAHPGGKGKVGGATSGKLDLKFLDQHLPGSAGKPSGKYVGSMAAHGRIEAPVGSTVRTGRGKSAKVGPKKTRAVPSAQVFGTDRRINRIDAAAEMYGTGSKEHREAKRRFKKADDDLDQLDSGEGSAIFKSATKRYTLAPWYVPEQLDAHDEWTTADELQKALWGYVRKNQRDIMLQHRPGFVAGELVEAMQWPYEVTLPMHKADGTIDQVTYPAGTVFAGTVWKDWAFELVREGHITGLSIGGKAIRVPGGPTVAKAMDEEWWDVEKHGNHDQSSHGRRGGGRVGLPATAQTVRMAPMPRPKTAAGQNLEQSHASLAGHADFDAIAAETGGRDPNHEQMYKHLSPERRATWDKIVDEHVAGVPESKDPTVEFMGGGGASGKSSILKNGLVEVPDKKSAVHVNPDDIKERLPGYIPMPGSGAAAITHEESSLISKRIQGIAIAGRKDMVIDAVGDSGEEKLTTQVAALRKNGHKVKAHYVSIDTDEAIRRSDKRATDPPYRKVPHSALREAHSGVSRVLPKVAEADLFDSVELFDNNGNGKPVKVMSKVKGQPTKVHDQALYARFLAKA